MAFTFPDRSSASRAFATFIQALSISGEGLLSVRSKESITAILSSAGRDSASRIISLTPCMPGSPRSFPSFYHIAVHLPIAFKSHVSRSAGVYNHGEPAVAIPGISARQQMRCRCHFSVVYCYNAEIGNCKRRSEICASRKAGQACRQFPAGGSQ